MEGGARSKVPEFKRQIKNIYTRTLVSKKVLLEVKYIGESIKDVLEDNIRKSY